VFDSRGRERKNHRFWSKSTIFSPEVLLFPLLTG